MEEKKKVIIPMTIGIISVVLFLIGITYAYFSSIYSGSIGTTTINGSLTGAEGGILFEHLITNLSLNLGETEMDSDHTGAIYYATDNDYNTIYSDENASNWSQVIGRASLIDSSDENTYNCTYNLVVSQSGTLYNKFKTDNPSGSTGQIKLNVNGTIFDFYNTNWANALVVPGTIEIDSSNQTNDIELGFMVKNTSTDQTHIKGTNINISVELQDLTCTVSSPQVEEPSTNEPEQSQGYYYGWNDAQSANFDFADGGHGIALWTDGTTKTACAYDDETLSVICYSGEDFNFNNGSSCHSVGNDIECENSIGDQCRIYTDNSNEDYCVAK